MVHYVEVKRTMHRQFLSYNIYRFHGLNIGHQVLCQLPLSDEPPCQQNKIKTIQQNNKITPRLGSGEMVWWFQLTLLTLISKDQTLLSRFCGHQAHMQYRQTYTQTKHQYTIKERIKTLPTETNKPLFFLLTIPSDRNHI